MRFLDARVALLVCLLSPSFGAAQEAAPTSSQPESNTITKDPQAVTVAAKAIAAMGGTQSLSAYQDSQATGTITLHRGTDTNSYPVTIKCKGTRQTRFELQRSNGTTVRIINQGRGQIHRPDGSIVNLLAKNTFNERVNHIPLLSLLAESEKDNVVLSYQGTALVDGHMTDSLALTLVPDPKHADLRSLAVSSKSFFVDQSTGLVLKIQYTNYSENYPDDGVQQEVFYTDYRRVNGILVPFHQVTYNDGNLESDLVLDSVSFNGGASDSDFTLSTGDASAQ
jgi:outer membrane lipoprotein-sorting protein